MIVDTASGTAYHFDGLHVRRDGGDSLRQDGEWLQLLAAPEISVGSPMVLVLEPLGASGGCTFRVTSPVTGIHEGAS